MPLSKTSEDIGLITHRAYSICCAEDISQSSQQGSEGAESSETWTPVECDTLFRKRKSGCTLLSHLISKLTTEPHRLRWAHSSPRTPGTARTNKLLFIPLLILTKEMLAQMQLPKGCRLNPEFQEQVSCSSYIHILRQLLIPFSLY